MRVRGALCAVALLIARAASAAFGPDYDPEEEKKGWQEIEVRMPPYPKTQDLVLVDAGSATSHKFYIDASSVSVGADGVTRYTAVVKTAGGATNVTFEGIRCQTREEKLYALGHNDGTWAPARNAKWQRVVLRELKPYPFVLYRDFFCASPTQPTSPKQAVEALRRGVPVGGRRPLD